MIHQVRGNEHAGVLVSMLLAAPSGRAEQAPPAASIAPRAVRRAEAYIEAHAGDAIRLDDIASAAGVPVRTLLDGFKRFRSCSPMQMLRERRLEHVRQRLLEGGPEARVACVALDCGFAHLGRFAGHYLQRYGESPSETLRRVQRLAA
ncbi:hypothetical protein GCM10025795_03220 [Verticiella sediminum]